MRHNSVKLGIIFPGIILFAAVVSWKADTYLNRQSSKASVMELSGKVSRQTESVFNRMKRLSTQEEFKKTADGSARPDNGAVLGLITGFKEAENASIVFILNPEGTVVACTPYNTTEGDKTLTGNNYRFRPYFTKALSGKQTHYGALGVTTGKRGFYYSVPIYNRGNDIRPSGVLVAKFSPNDIDRILEGAGFPATLVTADGIIFSAHDPEWRFKAGFPLSEPQQTALIKTRQFADEKLPPLGPNLHKKDTMFNGIRYSVALHPIMDGEWVLIAMKKRKIRNLTWFLFFGLIILGGIFYNTLNSLSGMLKAEHRTANLSEFLSVSVHGALVTTAVIIAFGAAFFDFLNHRSHLNSEYEELLGSKKQMISTIVDQAMEEIRYCRTTYSDSLKDEEIRNDLKKRLHSIAYADGKGYLFVMSYDGIALVNRSQPGLIGKDITRYSDAGNIKLVRDLIEAAQKPEGGYVSYEWNNPSTNRISNKLSYVKGVQDWRWVVGTGVYLDDIDEQMAETRRRQWISLGLKNGFILILAALVFLMMKITVTRISAQILSETRALRNGMEAQNREEIAIDPSRFSIEDFRQIASDAETSFNQFLKSRDAVKKSADQQRLILDNIDAGVIIIDAWSHVIQYVNPAAVALIGADASEICGRICHDHICPNKIDNCPITDQGKEADNSKCILLTADGRELPVLKSVRQIVIDDIPCLLETFVDISEQEKVLLELEKTTELASAANIAKSEFLANMSHEIRTPMNGVIGMINILLDSDLTDDQRRYAETVRSSAGSLLFLINDILDFSKIEAGKLELEVIRFDLESLLDDFAESISYQAYEKGLELICGLSPDVPVFLEGDPSRLRQILVNLAGNALKFTNSGEIAIKGSLMKETENTVVVEFSIRDTGIGIPEEKRAHLFEKFSQVDTSTSREYGGTGLGLAITKELLDLMGGKITISSEEGKGTEFRFSVEFLRSGQKRETTEIKPTDLTTVNALIVDDNHSSRNLIRSRFASWGIRVTTAESGPEALRAFSEAIDSKNPFNIALFDMKMPGMNGEELCRLIKGDSRYRNTALILLADFGSRGDAAHFRQIGFSGYLSKPVKSHELKSVLLAVLGKTDPEDTSIVTRHSAKEQSASFVDRNARILLVEDNVTNQQVATGLLKRFRFTPDIVENGKEAIKSLEQKDYDIVLMDIQMPVMDGFEATRIIRDPSSNVRQHDIPVIAMTANAMSGDREKCIRAGMDSFITKPVSYDSFARALDKYLPLPETIAPATDDSPAAQLQQDTIWDREGLLDRIGNDMELLNDIVSYALHNWPKEVDELYRMVDKGKEIEEIRRKVHRLKGAAANMGAEKVRYAAQEIEQLTSLKGIDGCLTELADAIEVLKKEISGTPL